mmetsp:Transcript_19388/g.36613  ORF Transcript_19388/g.36613 Transcript_19388/m.36613 type:complete len:649 (-) Transcript_19388:63-2009(-)
MNPAGYRLEEKKEERGSFGNSDAKSTHSYKSTHSTRSSVLERAREYNRRIEETRRRAKSLERAPSNDAASETERSATMTPRSKSVGRSPQTVPRLSTRERAMASVRRETSRGGSQQPVDNSPRGGGGGITTTSSRQTLSPTSNRQPQRPASPAPPQQRQKPSPGRLMRNHQAHNGQGQQQQQQREGEAVVSPELLVDALSGHEDGLLAIAEKLMEHYDGGYDVMGEAIIDAFADVQKLFQHVVEAAHMEGAAFEASRREEEMMELRRQAAAGELSPDMLDNTTAPTTPEPQSPNGPIRHDEFVDQDVKDLLAEAIRKGTVLRDANQHAECYRMYEQACQSASSLLPVDSDHRGRLQLSIARAESMNPDRACAILRYAMDDVLRSAMRAGRTPMPDPSKRADVVLNRPHGNAHTNGFAPGQVAGVIQSSDEALASMIEEMKEILSAPVYKDTPLQEVAQRFWVALTESQKNQQRNAEKLEQSLGKLKGEFLLARAEWEEKLNQSNEKMETYKGKYERLKDTRKGEDFMDQARFSASNLHPADMSMRSGGSQRAGSVASLGSGLAIHAKKLVNSINDFNCNALNERNNDAVMDMAGMEDNYHGDRRGARSPTQRSSPRSLSHSSRSSSNRIPSSRSYKEQYAKSPQRMDL